MTDKEKEIDEMVDIIVEELDKSYGCGLEIAGEKIYHIYRRKRKDACEKTAKKVRKKTAKEILQAMNEKMNMLTGCGVPYHVKQFMKEIAEKYGIEVDE